MYEAVVRSVVVRQFGDGGTYLMIHPKSWLMLGGLYLSLFWVTRK